jgi:hypothetical protein
VLAFPLAMGITDPPVIALTCPALALLTRPALRFCAILLGAAFVPVIAIVPAILEDPRDLLQNTVAYPLGLTSARSPAQSPPPGHLPATLGPAGHAAAVVLLLATGVAIAVSLVIRPPLGPAQAAARLALGLALMFALSPATRFGYFAYPLALWGWVAVSASSAPRGRDSLMPWRPESAPLARLAGTSPSSATGRWNYVESPEVPRPTTRTRAVC